MILAKSSGLTDVKDPEAVNHQKKSLAVIDEAQQHDVSAGIKWMIAVQKVAALVHSSPPDVKLSGADHED